MKRIFTYGELLDGPHNWHVICDVLDLNPWLLNEGQVDEADEVTITEEQWDLIVNPMGPLYDHPRWPPDYGPIYGCQEPAEITWNRYQPTEFIISQESYDDLMDFYQPGWEAKP